MKTNLACFWKKDEKEVDVGDSTQGLKLNDVHINSYFAMYSVDVWWKLLNLGQSECFYL